MPVVEFVGQSARDADNIAANPSRLVNLYREPVAASNPPQYALKSVLGTEDFADLDGVFVRALETQGGALYASIGGRLRKITSGGVVSDLGAITDSAATSISGNNGDVTIAAGGSYYVWDGAALSAPTPGAFSNFGSVEYISNYTILTERNGRRFQWSGIADASTLPALNFTTADGRDDNILRAVAINGLLYIFKERSHEIWYVTGGAGAEAFERQVGGVVDVGLKSYGLICNFDGGAFMVGDDGRAHIVAGGLQPVSIPAVETAIKTKTPEACFTYEDEGHTFLAIRFRDCPAWVYDLATGEWHERAQGADLGPWGATCSAKMGLYWYIGRDDGVVLALKRLNADAGDPLVREATSRALYVGRQGFICRALSFFMRVGFDAATVAFSFSRDGGITFGAPKARTWGVGDYGGAVVLKALGRFPKTLVARVRMSDPVDVSINAEMDVEI